jgi:hypothetical protein
MVNDTSKKSSARRYLALKELAINVGATAH